MTTTELGTTIAGVGATLRALEQGHARQVGALHTELTALAAQQWLVRARAPLAWSPWIPQPGGVRPPRSQEEATMERHGGPAMTRRAGSALSGTDAWSREARRVRERATHLGLALDEEELALQDVHDLQALHASLHGPWTGPTGTRWMGLRGLQGLWTRMRARVRVQVRATGAAAPSARRA